MRRRRRARPVLIGVLAAAGVFAGLATGLSLPSGGPHPIQLTLAVAASLLSGWLTAVQIGGGSDERPAAPDRPVASSPLSQLPPDLGDFADREAYLATLLERLESRSDDRIAIATVAGKAGVGKTALAIRVAHQVARRFPGGQLYVNLRGVEEQAVTPEDALAGFLRDLGVPGPVIPEDLQERARMYRARLAGRRVLVVLDNAADEVQIRPLVPSSPGSAVLVTSRRPLAGLEGAQPLVLDVMDHQAAHTLFSSVVGAQRVAADPEAASRIVDLCGGLPLAVRIAGARLATKPHWTLSGFVRRLSDEGERLAELRAGDLEVRASFALSYHDLEPRQHLAFQALGLSNAPDFAPWTLAALLDCTAREAADLLEGLADAQLVEAGGDDEPRYRFHDLLRVFARERLREEMPATDQAAAVRRLIEAYLARAEAGAAVLRYDERAPAVDEPLGWFNTEWAGLIAAVEQASAQGLDEATWRLAAAMTPYCEIRARLRDWGHVQQIALEAARRSDDARGAAVVQQHLGRLSRYRGRFDEAEALLYQSLAGFEALGDVPGRAVVLHHLGAVAVNQGRPELAETRMREALGLFRDLGQRHGEAQTLRWLAHICGNRGEFESAIRFFQEALPLFASLGDRHGEAQTLRWLGDVYGDSGRYDEAIECFDRCLPVLRDVDDPLGEAWALLDLGDVHRERGDLDTAMRCFKAAQESFVRYQSTAGEAAILLCLADVHRERGEFAAATAELDRARAAYRDMGDPVGEAWALLCFGDLHLAQGRHGAAVDVLEQAVPLFRAADKRLHEGRALRSLAAAFAGVGEHERSGSALAEALALFDGIGAPEAAAVRREMEAQATE
ncbi:hypothetical protein GCM10023170_072160 [Phytohabitans houttuyneae]